MTAGPDVADAAAPRPRYTRRRWLAAAAAIGGAAAAGCSRGDDRTIRFWAMGREGEVAAEVLRGFAAENPGVHVRIEKLPWSSAHEKLLTAFAGDATPDVAQMGNTWLPEMDALGAIEPLDTMLQATPSIAADDFFRGIWQTNRIGGRTVGVPWYVDTRLMFVRHDLVERAGCAGVPTDWSSWTGCLERLQALGIDKPILLPTNEFEPLLALALQQGGDLLRDGGRYADFSGPGFRRALAYYLQMFERGFAPGVANNQVANVWQEFGRGSFAFYVSGPWNIGEFKRRLPADLQSAWSTAPLPGPVTGGGPGASIAGGSSLVLFRDSPVKPLAWRLIEYLTRPAVQLDFYRLTGDLPPRRSTWALPRGDQPPLMADRHASAFARQLENVRAPPAVPEWERIAQEMQLAAARAVHDRRSVGATVAALDARVDEILEKRRWMLSRSAAG